MCEGNGDPKEKIVGWKQTIVLAQSDWRDAFHLSFASFKPIVEWTLSSQAAHLMAFEDVKS